MNPALTIARLIGPVFCTIGIGMLANQSTYRQMAGQFLAGYPFIYFSGILALVAGLAILNAHHRWTRDWYSVITALGWILDLRRRVPHLCAAVRRFRRDASRCDRRFLHRRRPRSARARRLPHLQRLCGVSAATSQSETPP